MTIYLYIILCDFRGRKNQGGNNETDDAMAFVAFALAMTTVAATADTSVKIGAMSDMTGPYADFSGPGSLDAVKMAVEDFRAANKAISVEVVAADPQNKPDNAAAIARRWFDTESVDLVIDVPTSGVALVLATIVKEKNKVMIATTAGTSDISGKACTPNSCTGPGIHGRIPTGQRRPSSGVAAKAGIS